jgi:hypothetical protein
MGKGGAGTIAAIVTATGALAAGAGRPGEDDVLTASNRKARTILEQAVAAHGGENAHRSVRTLRIEEEGGSTSTAGAAATPPNCSPTATRTASRT